jgi:hypothetical protein
MHPSRRDEGPEITGNAGGFRVVRALLKGLDMRGLGCLAVFFGCLGGCFPYEIDPDPGSSGGENFAPTIDPRDVSPSFLDPLSFPAVQMNPPREFSIRQVEDPNVDDKITLRLFADDKDTPLFSREIPPSGDVARNPNVIDEFFNLDDFRDQTGALTGRHRLVLLVADGDFAADSGPGARQLKDPATSRLSYYSWELEF